MATRLHRLLHFLSCLLSEPPAVALTGPPRESHTALETVEELMVVCSNQQQQITDLKQQLREAESREDHYRMLQQRSRQAVVPLIGRIDALQDEFYRQVRTNEGLRLRLKSESKSD